MIEVTFDICVIGGGPGGYVAAIRASQLGLKVCLIEREHLGGICLNWGCIPTKALLKASEAFASLKKMDDFGISLNGTPTFDMKKIVARSRSVSAKLSSGIKGLMKKNKVEVIEGSASFVSSGEITITTKDGKQSLKASHFVIATGARARVIPQFEPDGKVVLTYKEAMIQESLPKKLLVVGSGAIGIEFAGFYSNLGSDVTVLETVNRILPTEDIEVAILAEKLFKSSGMTIHVSASLVKFEKKAHSCVVTYKTSNGDSKTEEFDRVIMAVGVVPNTNEIDLKNTKVKQDQKNLIIVDKYLQTEDSKIFAIGDVIEGPWLAHKASHEGIIAAEAIAASCGKYDKKKIHTINRSNIPGCIYTSPQIASIGMTEEAAKKNHDIKVGRFPYMANGKAIAIGKTDGFIKTIFDKKTGELLGVHMIGADVTELIGTFALGKSLEATELDFIHTVFPHPTLSEMIHESVLDAEGRVVHI